MSRKSNTEQVEDSRAADRTLRFEPKLTKLSTDAVDAERTDCRHDNEDPRCICSMMEDETPTRKCPTMLQPELMRAKYRSENEEPQ